MNFYKQIYTLSFLISWGLNSSELLDPKDNLAKAITELQTESVILQVSAKPIDKLTQQKAVHTAQEQLAKQELISKSIRLRPTDFDRIIFGGILSTIAASFFAVCYFSDMGSDELLNQEIAQTKSRLVTKFTLTDQKIIEDLGKSGRVLALRDIKFKLTVAGGICAYFGLKNIYQGLFNSNAHEKVTKAQAIVQFLKQLYIPEKTSESNTVSANN